MNEKKSGAPLPIAAAISVVIVIAMIILNAVPEKLFGINTGWMAILMLSLYMSIALPTGLSMEKLKQCLFGTAYGIAAGCVYAAFLPGFFICALILLICKLSNNLPQIMNDYALCVLTVYSIAGVANLSTMWMNIVMYLVGALIITAITVIVTKKSGKA